MSSFYDDASLVVIPSGYKTSKVYAEKPTDGSGDLAFTRTGDTATRVASNGLIERVRTNLLLQSNTFSNAAWLKQDISVTSGQIGYDGTTNAWKLTPNTSNFAHYVYENIVTTGLLTFSVYAKPDGYNFILLYAGGYGGTFFDISTGTIGGNLGSAPSATKIEAAGNGFYRCSITVPSSADVAVFAANTISNYIFAGNGTSGVLIQSAQLETGDIATAYIATTSAAVSVGPVANVPRLDYLGSTCGKLLLEPQRTNLVTYSEQLNNAAWTKEGITITANATTSPDGYTNADKIVASASASAKYVYQILTVSNSVAYTSSAYFKAAEYTYAFFRLGGVTGNPYVIYNLSTQAVVATSGLTASTITAVGNGWYRVTATATQTSTTLAPVLMVIPSTGYTLTGDNLPQFTGDGTSGGFVWGCMAEEGAYATSLIPTLAASATRGAEKVAKTGITSLIGQTEGTIYFEINKTARTDSEYRFNLSDGSSDNWIFLGIEASNVPRFYVRAAASTGVDFSGSALSSGTHKVAAAYKQNDFVLYVDGVQVGSDTSGNVGGTSQLHFGGNYIDQVAETDSRTAQALLFKTRLTNAQLAELTTL